MTNTRGHIPIAIAWLAYSVPFIVWIDAKASLYKAKATAIELSGWPGLLYDWQQGWGGFLAAVAAAGAAAWTVWATRRSAAEQIESARAGVDAQVAAAKEAAQMQVETAIATLEQERAHGKQRDLVSMDQNLGMQMEMVRAWRAAFTDLRTSNEENIAARLFGEVRNFELPITLNITTDQCNLHGISDAALAALGDLSAANMRCRFAIIKMQRTGTHIADVQNLHGTVPGILDRIENAHSARRAEIRAALQKLAT